MKNTDRFNQIIWLFIIFCLVIASTISAVGIFVFEDGYMFIISFLSFGVLAINAEYGRRISKE